MPIPCKTSGIDCDPYLAMRQPSSTLDTRLEGVRDLPGLLPEAQENFRYGGSSLTGSVTLLP